MPHCLVLLQEGGDFRRVLCTRLLVLIALTADWFVQLGGGGYKFVDLSTEFNILPVTAVLRPVLLILRFQGALRVLENTTRTLYLALDVIVMLIIFVTIFLVIGVSLFRESSSVRRYFNTLPDAVAASFTFLSTGENFPELVWGSTKCPKNEPHQPNTRNGGVVSGHCVEWFLQPMFWCFEGIGLFVLVSLTVASFDSFYATRVQRYAAQERKQRRTLD